jgi:hypothetical protein
MQIESFSIEQLERRELVMCLESRVCFPKCPWHPKKEVTLTHILSVPETPLSRG